ncbi:unnamed protein product [Rhizophagus irregularis]|uniref:Uncharacterized protein n=1 Tax=Rhizophagus irregularis TaxID=588596 RepID=A0A2I1GRH6_9GLOM|nr:hypothetical protein RhiirA4_465159 [Rhizophagus irregularis]CAB4430987.1 unnamed protein product [Rhizophagus irregularis]
MLDSKLSPRDIKDMYSWQAVKRAKIDNEKSDDIIIKEHVRTYGGHFSKIIRINKVIYSNIFNNENDLMKAIYDSAIKDDLGLGLRIKTQDNIISKNGSLENGELQRRQKFSGRINELNGNTEGSKGKGKEVETSSDTLNSNKKRVALTQGNREDSDSNSDSDNRL